MKIKEGDYVFLQRYDVDFIRKDLNLASYCVLDEIFHPDAVASIQTIELDSAKKSPYEFAFVFHHPNNVAWLMKQDWIVDYDKYAKRPAEEIDKIVSAADAKLRKIVTHRNHSRIEKRRRDASFSDMMQKTAHHCRSLDVLYNYLAGNEDFIFPKALVSHAIRQPVKISDDPLVQECTNLTPENTPSILTPFEKLLLKFNHLLPWQRFAKSHRNTP